MSDAEQPTPPPRRGPRDPGDAWVEAPDGRRFWGRFGAAGLLAVDAERGILMQHRATWSHHGDTWGLPGGARHQGEDAVGAALREAREEAGVPAGAVRPRLLSVYDAEVWTYSTLVADVTEPFDPVISDPESRELAWIQIPDLDRYRLHPGFAASWPSLRDVLGVRPAVVVDAANVVGSVPDGWWRDRAGAAGRLLQRIAAWAAQGVDAAELGLSEGRWFPDVQVVLEGAAKAAQDIAGIGVVRASASGDDTIVAVAERLAAGRSVTVVTSDRGLAERVTALGATVRPVSWLRGQLPMSP